MRQASRADGRDPSSVRANVMCGSSPSASWRIWALFLALPRIVQTQPGTALNVIVALVPLAPVIWMIIAIARHVRRVDELQRLLFLRSFTFGFAVSMVTALTIALLSGGRS